MVLVQHLADRLPHAKIWQQTILAILGDGHTGVSIFFVISGFLITSLLLKERERKGTISVKNFYVRRTFRILPAYFVYLGTIFILSRVGFLSVRPSEFVPAIFFCFNYFGGGNWFLGHTWSLSVEEQFYLAWPLLLILLRPRRLVWLATALIVVEPFVRVATYVLVPHWRERIGIMAHTRADMLMFGCAAALLLGSSRFITLLNALYKAGAHWMAPIFLFLISPIAEYKFHGWYLLTVGYTLQGICIIILLLWLVQHPQSRAVRIFQWPPFVHLGLISYSLYLWQQLFTAFPRPLSLLMSAVLSIAAAEVSYFLVEQPVLRLRAHFKNNGAAGPPL